MVAPPMPDWNQAAEQFKKQFGDSWNQALASFQNMDLGQAGFKNLQFSPNKLSELQKNYIDEATRLWNDSLHANPSLKDRRFSGEAWSHNPIAAYTAAAYLLNARTLMGLADAVDADAKTRARIQFAVEQWVAASAPSN